jgi:outer membrane protein assembly factor BamB
MRKFALFCGCILVLCACDKHDPILPGVRTEIFDSSDGVNMLNTSVPDLPDMAPVRDAKKCEFTIDGTNTIRDGNNNKIFVGFPSSNYIDIKTYPVCDDNYVYAGLNTGNVVKIAPKSRRVMWMADVFAESNMMGGAANVDIVAPIVLDGEYLYAGGVGNAFCKIKTSNGSKKWCNSIGTRFPFVVLKNVAYITGMDDALYAVRLTDGAVYWKTKLKNVAAPKYDNTRIIVGRETFDASNGQKL